MEKVMEFIKSIVICTIVLVFFVSCFFGAVLQESYKLHPLTAAEVADE